ncbi:unnamed protein product [Pleuronectes platessa]|uniref:Uncharacterized protein n=1 Tax=Pleuronectes platessa TaxID=8262 RepID=A0A9N7U7G9_PLEPL|nr:unnamed protein product [Pleuronectes platessa]
MRAWTQWSRGEELHLPVLSVKAPAKTPKEKRGGFEMPCLLVTTPFVYPPPICGPGFRRRPFSKGSLSRPHINLLEPGSLRGLELVKDLVPRFGPCPSKPPIRRGPKPPDQLRQQVCQEEHSGGMSGEQPRGNDGSLRWSRTLATPESKHCSSERTWRIEAEELDGLRSPVLHTFSLSNIDKHKISAALKNTLKPEESALDSRQRHTLCSATHHSHSSAGRKYKHHYPFCPPASRTQSEVRY